MIKPLGNRVLVVAKKAEEKSAGGIYIPDGAQEAPAEGIVVGVGSEVECEIKTDDIVLYGKYAGTEIEHDDEKYLIIRESDLMAVVIP